MDRRTLIFGLGSFAASLPSSSYAQSLRIDSPLSRAWSIIPSIVVVSPEDDPRLPAVREAIEFWHAQLSKLGSPFRLGATARIVGMIPAGDLHALRTNFSSRAALTFPDSIRRVNADVIVALSDVEMAKFNPVTFGWSSPKQALVAIPSHRTLMQPAIVRNVMAHEFGHVIGLDHNAEPTALMCGGGARCTFSVPREGYLPLISTDKAKILEMYPTSWEPNAPSKRWKGDPPSLTAG